MAGLTSGDRRVDSTNGAVGDLREIVTPFAGAFEDGQMLGDRHQTFADADQAAVGGEQAASDRDLVRGGDRDVHDFGRDSRGRGAEQRPHRAQRRVEVAAVRDGIADARDLAASARDLADELRDRELATRDAASAADERALTSAEFVRRAVENHDRATADRAAAAEARGQAAANREHEARDREQAAGDRLQAHADRDALRHQLAIAETDELTGTRTRAAGLADVDHEIDRARRTSGLLVIAYVEIVGVKVVNDAYGHDAGDAVIQRAVQAIRRHLRSYDAIVRLAGDEFLCVMAGATIEDARQRFGAIQTTLATDPDRCEINVGFAELTPEDSVTELIKRADAERDTSSPRARTGR